MGFCYGSLVAHEIAVRLAGWEQPVDLLILGDVAPRSPPRFRADKRPLSRPRSWLRKSTNWLEQKLAAMDPANPAIPDRTLSFLHDAGKSLPDALAGVLLPRTISVLTKRQIARWRPRPFAGCSNLLVTSPSRAEHPDLGEDLGWNPYCANLHVAQVDGDHADFFDAEHTPAFLRAMDSALAIMRNNNRRLTHGSQTNTIDSVG
jgi:thioesterase domain-containing protein